MKYLKCLIRRVRILVAKERVDEAMEKEMRLHLELETEDRIRSGMAPEEARRSAAVDFGGVERFKERARDARGGRLLDNFVQDFRYAARSLWRRPGTALFAVVALGLGIGLTAIWFSIVYGALYRGLPFPEGERILHLSESSPSRGQPWLDAPIHDFLDWKERQTSFEELAAFFTGTVNISGTERPERFASAHMTANGFRPLRVQPILGRTFMEGEEGPETPNVIIVGHHVWQERYGGDPDIIGRTVRVNGRQTTIIGVMPEGFRFPNVQDVWLPLRMNPLGTERGGGYRLNVYGRLRDRVTREEAETELSGIAARLAEAYPDSNEGVGARLEPFTDQYAGRDTHQALLTGFAIVLLVLVVACINVANLLLARTMARTRDLAIRTAMGAARGRIVMQLVAEAGVLALAGAVLGIAIAWVGIDLFDTLAAATAPPFWFEFALDGPVLAYVLAATVGSALLSGVVPGLKASGAQVQEVLKEESRGATSLRIGRLSRLLVLGEVALSTALLVGAGAGVKAMIGLRALDFGFATEEVLTARVGLAPADFPDGDSRRDFYNELLDRLRDRPGVAAAALTTNLPGMFSSRVDLELEGESYPADRGHPRTHRVMISPGFFDAFDVSVVRGRAFTRADDEDALPVAIVNASWVARFSPDREPIGRRIREGGAESGEAWLTIVGVAPDMLIEGLGTVTDEHHGIYLPLTQRPYGIVNVAVRAHGDPLALASMLREEVARTHSDTPIYRVATLESAIRQGVWFIDLFGGLFAIFGVAALFMAGIGLYGVVSFSTSQRTKELGLRMALGAKAGDVRGLVMRQGAFHVSAGLALGVVLGGFIALIFRQLHDTLAVAPWDASVLVTVSLVLLLCSVAASLLPARRATRVDPLEALRYE